MSITPRVSDVAAPAVDAPYETLDAVNSLTRTAAGSRLHCVAADAPASREQRCSQVPPGMVEKSKATPDRVAPSLVPVSASVEALAVAVAVLAAMALVRPAASTAHDVDHASSSAAVRYGDALERTRVVTDALATCWALTLSVATVPRGPT